MDRLVIISEKSLGTAYELGKGPAVIGRGGDCAVRLDDRVISRWHARLYCSGGQWWIEDLGSRNGTFVNGQKITSPQRLHRDDRVQIGETTLVFETDLDLLEQTWADEPILSSPAQEDTNFEDTVEPLWFHGQTFDPASLGILYRLSALVSASTELPCLVRDSLRAIRSCVNASVACLFLTERAKPPFQPALVLSDEASPMVSQTAVLYCIRSRRAICIRDSRSELPPSDVLNLMGEAKGRSLMCAPLLGRNKLVGAVLVDRPQPNAFDHRALALFTAIAHQVGNGIFILQEIERLETMARAAEADPGSTEALLGSSTAVKDLRQRIAEVAESDEPVLIVGERGSGKHDVAREIHHRSPRMRGPLVWFHALSVPPERIAGCLLGVEQVQTPETVAPTRGKIETAHGGTLVIEEIGASPLEVQTALLAYLKTLRFARLGGQRRYFADVRLIATTSEPLENVLSERRFEEELLRTISGHSVVVPPLRERGEDLIELATEFALRVAPLVGRRTISLTPPVLRALQAYRWPGNVRELRNVVERAVWRCRSDQVQVTDLPFDVVSQIQQTVEVTLAENP